MNWLYHTITSAQYILPFFLLLLIYYVYTNSITHTNNGLTVVHASLIWLIMGITLQHWYRAPLLFLFLASSILFIFFIFFACQAYTQSLKYVLFLLIALSSAISMQLQQTKNNCAFAYVQNKLLLLQGTITQTKLIKRFNTIRYISVTLACQKPFSCNLLCYLYTSSKLAVGDQLQLKNIKLQPARSRNRLVCAPQFSDFLCKENILTTLFLQRSQWQTLPIKNRSLTKRIAQVRDNLYSRLRGKLHVTTFNLFSALFLGNKQEDKADEKQYLFGFWGITHFLARSGLHVALFSMLWSMFFYCIPIPFTLKHVLLILMCILYYLLSWPSISFLRALSVFMLYQVGILLNAQTNVSHLLSLVCLAFLLFNPMHIFFLDFQLSFALAFGLSFFLRQYKHLNRLPVFSEKN